MRETKFIEQNQEKWAEFEEMLREKRRDPEKLNHLFVQITDDLSYARTFYPNRSVRVYLNHLAQLIFHHIYRGKRFPAERFRLFWSDELPRVMWASRYALLLSFAVFVVAMGIGVLSSRINPEFARMILGDSYVEMTLENIRNKDPMGVYKSHGAFGMSWGIALNNLFVAFQTAVMGVVASVGTLVIMLRNGVMVGVFQYFFIERGLGWESFLTIWVHGALEISAIIIAGAAGLTAGSGWLFPGSYRRGQAFRLSVRRGMMIFFGITPIILLAAFFEGFFTRLTDTPWPVRLAFVLLSFAFVLWYFVWLPWHKARSGAFAAEDTGSELPPEKREAIRFDAIKNAGEILSDTFTLLKRDARTTALHTLGGALLFCIVAFLATAQAPRVLFPESRFDSFYRLYDYVGTGWLHRFTVTQVLLLTAVGIGAFRIIRLEMSPDKRPAGSVALYLRHALYLLLPTVLFIQWLKFESNALIWLASWAVMPFIGMWRAAIQFESANPLSAIVRVVAARNWGAMLLVGFFNVHICLLLLGALDLPVWDHFVSFFSWLAPEGEGSVANFHSVVTTWAMMVILYAFVLLNDLSGALLYFSHCEINEASGLVSDIGRIGLQRKIRGLPRE